VKVGSLCTGILGAELALEMMGMDPDLRWYSEIDKDACKILAERVPGVPNLGDLKLIEWERVGPQDGADVSLIPTPTAWLGRRPSQGDGDAARWENPERSRELSDFVAWMERA